MIERDISFETPEENIVFDNVLLDMAEQNQDAEYLRFWESPVPFVVLGRIGKLSEDVNIDQARRDKVPVLRRCSGGGTVVQGRGCLNYALVINKKRDPTLDDISKSYIFLLNKICTALRNLDIRCVVYPISDIALDDGRKFSGNAQKRGRNFILHHGTILYDFDLALVSKYLLMPRDMPQYRNNRPHHDFIVNCGRPQEHIKREIRREFECKKKVNSASENELSCLNKMICGGKVSVAI